MNVFLDTSALVKLFHEEKGTEAVTDFIKKTNVIWISELAKLEIISAFCRMLRRKDINVIEFNRVLELCDEQMSSFKVIPLGSVTLEQAGYLLKEFGIRFSLRTLDAIHLAAFTLLADKSWKFIAADEAMCNIARLLSYDTINPLQVEI